MFEKEKVEEKEDELVALRKTVVDKTEDIVELIGFSPIKRSNMAPGEYHY